MDITLVDKAMHRKGFDETTLRNSKWDTDPLGNRA